MLEEVKVKTKLHETKPVSLTKVLGSPLHHPTPLFKCEFPEVILTQDCSLKVGREVLDHLPKPKTTYDGRPIGLALYNWQKALNENWRPF